MTDYTAYAESISIKWPATNDLPTAEVVLDNTSGVFAGIPLSGTLKVTLPNGVGPFYFDAENPAYQAGRDQGHRVPYKGRANPELVYLTEGNLDVVGTDIYVGEWDKRATLYSPYPSKFVSALSTNLLDVGDMLTALFHTAQPDQTAGYRGRLGYDATGQGLASSAGADYIGGSLGYFVKGMWSVGRGSTGAQKTGLDVLRDALTKNLISDGTHGDVAGAPVVMDYYVDNRQVPSLVTVLLRGSAASGITLVMGTDPIQNLDLPVDSEDVRNFILLWENNETVYPGGGDAWSNYLPVGSAPSQWVQTNNSGPTAPFKNASTTPFGTGTSLEMDYVGGGSGGDNTYTFAIAANNYATLSQSQGRALSEVQFYFQQNETIGAGTNDMKFYLYDETVSPVASVSQNWTSAGVTFESGQGNSANWFRYHIPIPATGITNWTLETGSWDFKTATITKMAIRRNIQSVTVGGNEYFDLLHFVDNWTFSPVYSYNLTGPSATTVQADSASGQKNLNVFSIAGFVVGQYVLIGFGTARQELAQIASMSTQVLTMAANLTFTHTAAQADAVVGQTHDPNSVTAYGIRMFNFVDFYANQPGTDAAPAIAQNILLSRKGKKSTGTIKVSGYLPGLSSITPGSRIQVTDAKDVYVGGTADSTITGWLVDQVQYDLDRQNGFTATLTVEPYYAALVAGSPDSNLRNLWRNVNFAQVVSRLYRQTQVYGVQK